MTSIWLWIAYEQFGSCLKNRQKTFIRRCCIWILLFQPITKACIYNFDPLKPHFYIVKLGFTGVYIIFLISLKTINCGYLLEPPHWGGSNECPQSMFWAEIRKNIRIFIWKPSFLGGEIFSLFEQACFRNAKMYWCFSYFSTKPYQWGA